MFEKRNDADSQDLHIGRFTCVAMRTLKLRVNMRFEPFPIQWLLLAALILFGLPCVLFYGFLNFASLR